MKGLTHALVAGALGFGLVAGAHADAVTNADKKQADANYEAAVEKAKADYTVARKHCDALKGNDKDVCVKEAKAGEQRARSDAKAQKEAAEANAEAREHKRDADYDVAKEKCDALSGPAKDACLADAKARLKGRS